MSTKIQYYGLSPKQLPPNIGQFEIELLHIGVADSESIGGLHRSEHIKHVIQMLYPWVWKNWHEWNELMLWAWCKYKEIGMTGCSGAHKTFSFTLFAFIEFLAKPMATSVVLTSTTVPSLRARVWSELMSFYSKGRTNFTTLFGFNPIDSKTMVQSKKGDDKYAIRAIAVDSGDIEQAVGKIQGVHPDRMIMMVDEAAQTQPAIFTARANLQVGTKFFRFVAIANAVDQFDAHGKFCEPKNGWSTITVNDTHWDTKTGICLHFDGLKSPNVKAGKEIYPKLFSQLNVDTIRHNHGENSLEWWSYVRGFWAPSGTRNTVLDAAMIFDSQADQKAIWEGSGKTQKASLDPAFTTRGDRCILRFAYVGNFVDGSAGLEFTDIVNIRLEERKDYPLNYQIADRVIEECTSRGIPPRDFIMDATSASGLADIISQRWSPEIVKIQFGGLATSEPVSMDDTREANKVYKNRVTQLWFNVNKMVMSGRIRGLDEETSKEFCTRQYELKNEKTILEPKDQMKIRTAGTSPDLADAAALLCCLFLQQNGFQNSSAGYQNQQAEWEKLVNKYALESTYS